MSIKEHPPRVHEPVLLQSILDTVKPSQGESYLDLTAGYGGHAKSIFSITGNYRDSVLVDRDANTYRYLQKFTQYGTEIIQSDFVTACTQLIEAGRHFNIILADLGVSSPQLDRAERGFSFMNDGPLDMRMDQSTGKTAADIVNCYSQIELEQLIVRYGEEPRAVARRIARAILEGRPYARTSELANVIKQAARRGRTKIHPATRTFQALRIEINDELHQVEEMLALLTELLLPGGRAAVISFHSLEDRLVKTSFSEQVENGYEAELEVLTKKPILGADQDVHNPRARSAKLRVARKK